ncbi:cytidylyltransferase domain-containing protein [Tepidimicrobium xylanilyticum]|uniref:Spore coat polysaccharide biosynthesis protein SpsF n=1 Tax=Tepidimicrobium xylanilyticum TaxID=1123352 RepID=A0A1H2QST9_9FIRM|nr:glycosyltransferase family protein [Tepidimicrobium xylanilyticum]SDW09714.1 spore coat polysaccharide biosynthesis protein SpsF [Tepidimicrobium xylanilyticum]
MKILCIVQARMGSERLPKKVIKPILGQPMIIYTLNRLKKSKYIDELVLATSVEKADDPLVNVVKSQGYKIFRGDEKNVLKRFVDTYEKYGGDIIVRITGDCPLIDPIIVDNVITYFLSNDYDYVRLDVPDSFIRGFDVEVFTSETLLKVWEKVSSLEESNRYKEHVTLYIYENPNVFKVGSVKGSEFYSKSYRLSVDTIEDFKVVEAILNHFQDEYVEAKEIVKFLDENSNIADINKDVKQKEV